MRSHYQLKLAKKNQNLFDSICISGMTCQEYGKKLVRQNMLGGGIGADGQGGGGGLESLLLLDSSGDGNIKQCPMCHLWNDQAT